MRAVAIIPARLGSTRLPRKVLADLGGVPLVVRVVEQVRRCGALQAVFVATPDEEVAACLAEHDVPVVWTGPALSGTDRVAQAVVSGAIEAELVINVQGDEPFVDPSVIDRMVAVLRTEACPMVTACAPLRQVDRFRDPSVVKVVPDARGRALFFSRAPVPWPRDAVLVEGGVLPESHRAWEHLGVYGFRAASLRAFAELPPHPLERQERLEQLRALAWGWSIELVEATEAWGSVDTAEELRLARQRFEVEHG